MKTIEQPFHAESGFFSPEEEVIRLLSEYPLIRIEEASKGEHFTITNIQSKTSLQVGPQKDPITGEVFVKITQRVGSNGEESVIELREAVVNTFEPNGYHINHSDSLETVHRALRIMSWYQECRHSFYIDLACPNQIVDRTNNLTAKFPLPYNCKEIGLRLMKQHDIGESYNFL